MLADDIAGTLNAPLERILHKWKILTLAHTFAYNSESVLLQRASFSHAGTHTVCLLEAANYTPCLLLELMLKQPKIILTAGRFSALRTFSSTLSNNCIRDFSGWWGNTISLSWRNWLDSTNDCHDPGTTVWTNWRSDFLRYWPTRSRVKPDFLVAPGEESCVKNNMGLQMTDGGSLNRMQSSSSRQHVKNSRN